MSGIARGGLRAPPRHRWGWFVALGVLQLLLGVFAWFDVVLVTFAGVLFIGAALLVGGVFQIVHAFAMRGWRGFVWQLLAGLLYVIGGLLIMREPLHGTLILTVFIAAAMVVAGLFRIVLAVGHRDHAGWWLMLLGGLVSVAVGVLLLAALPWSGLWVIGTLIAVELIVHGIASISFGLAVRRLTA